METLETITFLYKLLPIMIIGIFIITLIICCIVGTINKNKQISNYQNERIINLLIKAEYNINQIAQEIKILKEQKKDDN